MFDEYRQVEGSESHVQKGTGLGLSIAKKFAELPGGTIGVESEVGRGSTVDDVACEQEALPLGLPVVDAGAGATTREVDGTEVRTQL